MRFNQPIKPGNDASIDYDGIQWDENAMPETLNRTGQQSTLAGRVEEAIPQNGCVDAHFLLNTGNGEFKIFANGDVFDVSAGPKHATLIGIDATITVDERRKVVA